MMAKNRDYLFRLAAIVCFVYTGCAPTGVHPGGGENHGCKEPPPDTFTSVGVDARFAQSTFGKVVTGDVDVSTNPSVVSLASKAVIDARIKDYLRCLAINRDRFTNAQAIYLETMNTFFATNPTPDTFIKWQEMHPFPARSDEQMKFLEKEVESLREQISNSNRELHALQERSKDRRLTGIHRLTLVAALRKGVKGEIELTYLSGNAEAEHLALDIGQAFLDSGWTVTDNSVNQVTVIGRTPVGVRVVVKDPQMPSVQSLLSAFKQIDLQIELKINPNLDRPIKVTVGSKP